MVNLYPWRARGWSSIPTTAAERSGGRRVGDEVVSHESEQVLDLWPLHVSPGQVSYG